MIVRPIEAGDRDAWQTLWEGYNTFYERRIPDEVTATTWSRFFMPDEPVHAAVADENGVLLGLVHWLYHRNTAMIAPVCYLQDLFTSEAARGRGVGRALIEAVHAAATDAGSARVYWQTHETNATARRLYDRLAERTGFIVYRQQIDA